MQIRRVRSKFNAVEFRQISNVVFVSRKRNICKIPKTLNYTQHDGKTVRVNASEKNVNTGAVLIPQRVYTGRRIACFVFFLTGELSTTSLLVQRAVVFAYVSVRAGKRFSLVLKTDYYYYDVGDTSGQCNETTVRRRP